MPVGGDASPFQRVTVSFATVRCSSAPVSSHPRTLMDRCRRLSGHFAASISIRIESIVNGFSTNASTSAGLVNVRPIAVRMTA